MKTKKLPISNPVEPGNGNSAPSPVVSRALLVTTDPVLPGNTTGLAAEFGRTADVHRVFGIRRGTAYNLLNDGKIKGCLLRVRGQKSGVRLFDMASVRAYIRSEMDAQ